MNICEDFYVRQIYVTPEEKHMFVKVIAFCLYLLDGKQAEGKEAARVDLLDQKKRISISKLDRIFKSIEVVPLFGDMNIEPFSFVRRSEFYDASRWPLSHFHSTFFPLSYRFLRCIFR